MPFTKPSGSRSHQHISLLRKAQHLSRSLTLCFFFGILKLSAPVEFHVQIAGKFYTTTKLFLALADVLALTKPFGSSGIDTVAETAYTQNQRSQLSLSEAGIGESWQFSHLLSLLSFLPS